MEPTPGRIVLFTPKSGDSENGAKEYVAIIGQVIPAVAGAKPYCNLLVCPPFQDARWEGSVQEGEGPRTWRWPQRT